MRAFTVIALGQIVSLLGSALTRFALGAWVFQRTGSVTKVSLILFAAVLPAVIIGPIAGVLVDRRRRLSVLMWSDAVGAAAVLGLILFPLQGANGLWAIGAAVIASGIASAFQEPALAATVAEFVPRKDLVRANGLLQFGHAGTHIVAPMLAGALLGATGPTSILTVDLLTFAVSIGTIVFIQRSNHEPRPPGGADRVVRSLRAELASGLRFITAQRALFALLLVYGSINLCAGVAQAVFAPMILSFTTAAGLGAIMSAGGIGMVVGSLFMMARRTPSQMVGAMMGAGALFGICMIVGGARASSVLVGAANFGMMFSLPLLNGYDSALWQSKVSPEMQGRVFSLRNVVGSATLPVAYVVAGPLAERAFEPLVLSGRIPLIATLVGEGPGRGCALMLLLLGVLIVIVCVSAWSLRLIRDVDSSLPDLGVHASE